MSGGWIKLHRSLLKWEWYDDINTLKLFLHLLLTANHEPRNWRGQTIGRGRILTSRAKLAKETKLSERQIRTCFSHLKSTNEVTIESTKKQSIITLCNYDTYQTKELPTDQRNDQQKVRVATNNRPSNEQEGKELKKRKKSPSAEVVAFPEVLDNSEFKAKWEEWLNFRKDSKMKKLLPVSIKAQLVKLATHGSDTAIKAVEASIANGWQGIFPDRINQTTANGNNRTFDRNANNSNSTQKPDYSKADGHSRTFL